MAKLKRKQDDKAQSERFIDKARELEADESGKVFERAFKRILPVKGPNPKHQEDP